MKTTFIIALFVGCILCASKADIIPPELVGVWAPKTSKIKDGLVYEGYAVYLQTNGLASIIAGPPALGALWHATYNSTNHVLIMITPADPDDGLPQGITNCIIYDPKAKTLIATNETSNDVLFRRSKRVPEDAFE